MIKRLAALLFIFSTLVAGSAYAGSDRWMESFWFSPISPQGAFPESFGDAYEGVVEDGEGSLFSVDCGNCHTQQYEDWLGSRHTSSMSSGVMGQLHAPWVPPDKQVQCQSCHAPLYEQNRWTVNGTHTLLSRLYDKELRKDGDSCAVCHVRRNVYYGPPPEKVSDPIKPHGGYLKKKDFNSSQFCKSCHQFPAGGQRIAGKLLMDTYNEWKASPAAEAGKSCSSCHMPHKAHMFRGIHTRGIVSAAIDTRVVVSGSYVSVFITNSGVGHKFPTYSTPLIIISGEVITLDGKRLAETKVEHEMGWKIKTDKKEEFFDRRLKPGEKFVAKFLLPTKYHGNKFEVNITVYPDEFYTRFFAELLTKKPKGVDVAEIKKAYKETLTSSYSLLSRQIPF